MLSLLVTTLSIELPDAPHSSAEWKIAAYSSAAPAPLSAGCGVMEGTTVLRASTNGWTCLAANPRPMPEEGWPSAHVAMPLCTDSEGLKWIQGAMSGAARDAWGMSRDGFAWMLHGDVGEDNTTPFVLDRADATGPWIESGPHLMLFPADFNTLAAFPSDPYKGEPFVMFPGTPAAHLMIPVPSYYDYHPEIAAPPVMMPEYFSHTSDLWKIAAYSSACPSPLSAGATVMEGTTVLRAGTNGWTAMAANPRPMPEGGWPSAHAAMPLCFDAVGLKWMQGWMGGAPRDTWGMERDSFVWMLHGDVGEDNSTPMVLSEADATGDWIESGPHLMLFPKDVATLAAYPSDPYKGEPYVMFPDDDQFAHLMIPMPSYYDYTPSVSSSLAAEAPRPDLLVEASSHARSAPIVGVVFGLAVVAAVVAAAIGVAKKNGPKEEATPPLV